MLCFHTCMVECVRVGQQIGQWVDEGGAVADSPPGVTRVHHVVGHCAAHAQFVAVAEQLAVAAAQSAVEAQLATAGINIGTSNGCSAQYGMYSSAAGAFMPCAEQQNRW